MESVYGRSNFTSLVGFEQGNHKHPIWYGKKVEAFCRREALAAFLIGLMVIILAIGWMATYMNFRVQNKTLEYQRDSVSIRLDRVMRTYDTQDTITKDYDIQKANGTMD